MSPRSRNLPKYLNLQYDLDLILDPISVQPFNKFINTQGLVTEVKVTNFSQIYVIHVTNGEERIEESFALGEGSLPLSLKMKC